MTMQNRSRNDVSNRTAKALVFSGLLLGSIAAQAQNDTQTLDVPPPLTVEELTRSINSPEEGATRANFGDNESSEQAADGEERFSETQTSGQSDAIIEYRLQQKLYLIEVKPRLGGKYFLTDNDGDGTPDEYRQNAEADTNIGKWKIGSW